MENIVTEEIKWVPMTSDERPAEYEDVLVVIDRWSSITGKWVKNDVLETKWLGEYFDICAPYRWSPEHMPKIKYWAFMPVGPVDPEQKVDYDYRNRRETEYMAIYPLRMNEKATIKDAIDFVYGPEDKRSYRGTIHILANSDLAPELGKMHIEGKTGTLSIDPDGPFINTNIKILPKSAAWFPLSSNNTAELTLLINEDDLAKEVWPNGEEH